MASLSNTKIKDTYESLVKFSDNGNITIGAKQLTDGFGNNSPFFVSTTQIGIGVTPSVGFDLHVNSNSKIGGNLIVSGNLTVSGTLTYLDVEDLATEDPLIKLARNNAGNSLDIGYFGQYVESGVTKFKGLFNDADDNKFKLFIGTSTEPTTVVNTGGTGYTIGTLIANLEGNVTGNLTGNADTATGVLVTADNSDTSRRMVFTESDNTTDSDGRLFKDSASNFFYNPSTNILNVGTVNGNVTGNDITVYNVVQWRVSSTDAALQRADARDDATNFSRLHWFGVKDNGNTSNFRHAYYDGASYINVTAASGVLSYTGGASFTGTLSANGGINGLTLANGGITGSNYNISGVNQLTIGDPGEGIVFVGTTTLTLAVIDDTVDDKLKLTNATQLDLNSTAKITNLVDPTNDQDAATKKYVDDNLIPAQSLSEVLAVGNTSGANDIIIADDQKIIFGAGSDLKIYHDGDDSYIKDENSTGDLKFLSSTTNIKNAADSETLAKFTENSGVELYFNNVKKFETTTNGIYVTGSGIIDGALTAIGQLMVSTTTPIFALQNGTGTTKMSVDFLDVQFDSGFAFKTNSTTALTLTNDQKAEFAGNVGINIAPSTRSLSVQNRVAVVVSGTTANAAIIFGDDDDDSVGQVRYNNSDDSMELRTDSTAFLTADSSQNSVFAGSVTATSFSGPLTGNVTGLASLNTPLNDIRSLGVQAFTNGTNPNITTAEVIAEIESDGGFDSFSSVFKTSWSYAGNYNLTDAGRFTETAGSSWITWTDNASDTTRGNITALAIAPTTGGSAGKVFIYNDQGTGYNAGWREVWTNTSDGAGSGLDADLLDGQQGTYYAPATGGSYVAKAGDTMTGNLKFGDNNLLLLGAGDQFQIGHKATFSQIATYEGHLYIDNNATDQDIIFRSDDASGGLVEYFRVDGGDSRVIYGRSIQMADNVSIVFGNDDDGLIRYDSTAGRIIHTGSNQFSSTIIAAGNISQTSGSSKFINGAYLEIGTGKGNTAQFTFNADYDGGQTDTYTPNYSGASSAGMTVIKMPGGGIGGLDLYVKNHGTTSGSHALTTFTKVIDIDQSGLTTFPDGGVTFSNTVTMNGAFNFTNAAPMLIVTSTNNSSGFRISVNGLDGDNDLLFRVQDTGTTRFTINRDGKSYFTNDVYANYITGIRLRVGDGTDGYFYSDTAGRTAFTGGDFYIQSGVTNYYNYATNQFLGNTSGDSIYLRGNTISGNSWSITGAGAGAFATVGVTNIVTNKIVKFNGSVLDDSNITDDGSTVSVTGNLSVSGNVSITGKSVVYKGTNIDRGDTIFEITEFDDTNSLRDKLNNQTAGITRVDDSTAPDGGCWQMADIYRAFTIEKFIKVHPGQEYIFETWIKYVSGADTNQKLYMGASFYDANKDYLGNSQRYWGESSLDVDANSRNDGWYHTAGTLGPTQTTGDGNIPTAARWMKLIMLVNYSSNANTIRLCGTRCYHSGGIGKQMITSLYRKSIGSTVGSSAGDWVGTQVIDTSGNLYANNGTFTGKVITTELESATTILLDAAQDITIDAGGGDIILSDDASIFGTISSSGGLQIRSRVNNADMFLRGVDNNTEFDALRLDMSENGNAFFSGGVTTGGTITANNLASDKKIAFRRSGANNFSIEHDASSLYFYNESTTNVCLKIANNSNVTFTGNVQANGGIKVVGPASHNTITSANDYTLGLNDSNGTSQWWFKAYTNGGFAIHENTVGDKFTISAGGNASFNGNVEIKKDTGIITEFNIGGVYGKNYWTRSYVVSNTLILPILLASGSALENGGAYRVTAHIDGTGTDQSSKAVFWNQNGTWFCNVTAQSGTSSNHILFLISGGVPAVKTYHPNNYSVRCWHERINLNEGTGNDNSRHYFGADSYMQMIGNQINLNYPTLLNNDTYLPQYITHSGDTNTQFGFSNNDQFIVKTNGNSNIFCDATQTILYCVGAIKLRTISTGVKVTGEIQLNDANTKLLEGNGNAVRIQTNSGYVDVGPQNTSYCHFITDRSRFYFSHQLVVNGNVIPYTSLTRSSGSATNLWNTTYTRYIESHPTQGRVKFSVWSGSTYGYGMQTGYTFGPIDNEYVLTSQMNTTAGRGWWWGTNAQNNAQGCMALGNNGRLTVATSLRLGYGTSDTTNVPSYALDVSGDIRATSDVIAFSDKRVKENIVTVDNALNKVTKLRGVTYTRKDIDDKSTKIGVIAQEVLEVLPEVVSIDDEDKHSVAYGNMAGVFIEAIKELKAEVDSLKEEIKELKK